PSALGQDVEGTKAGGRLLGEHPDARLGRVDAVLKRVEHLRAVGAEDDELSVEHVSAAAELELREVAGQRLAVARLHEGLVAIHEDDRPKAVVLGLVAPSFALLKPLAGE